MKNWHEVKKNMMEAHDIYAQDSAFSPEQQSALMMIVSNIWSTFEAVYRGASDAKNVINITWLSDRTDCNHTGCSGGYSEGARVTMNGDPWIELIPTASCFGGDHWSESDVYKIIFEKLGYELNN